jgi:hypothetical protein
LCSWFAAVYHDATVLYVPLLLLRLLVLPFLQPLHTAASVAIFTSASACGVAADLAAAVLWLLLLRLLQRLLHLLILLHLLPLPLLLQDTSTSLLARVEA